MLCVAIPLGSCCFQREPGSGRFRGVGWAPRALVVLAGQDKTGAPAHMRLEQHLLRDLRSEKGRFCCDKCGLLRNDHFGERLWLAQVEGAS